VVLPDDRNCMAVVQYAIESLSVRHVIVCGHYGCGGIQAALEGSPLSTVTAWLKPVRRLAERHRLELASIQTLSERRARLCELNVVHQVDQLANSLVVRNAVAAGRRIILHGWIYDLRDGLLRDLSVSVALG
jgi:carbonic anhydrase